MPISLGVGLTGGSDIKVWNATKIPSTVKQISKKTGLSESAVRYHLHYFSSGLNKIGRPAKYSRKKGWRLSKNKVWVTNNPKYYNK